MPALGVSVPKVVTNPIEHTNPTIYIDPYNPTGHTNPISHTGNKEPTGKYISSNIVTIYPAGEYSYDPSINLFLGRNSGPYRVRNATAAAADTLYLPPIPLEWIIAPVNVTEGQCPTANQTLQTFGLVNLVVALLLVIFGCRPIIKKLSCGLLGRRHGNSVWWVWTLGLSMQLLGNLFASLVVVRTPGYELLGISKVFGLYSSRPRFSLWWLSILRTFVARDAKRYSDKSVDEKEFLYVDSYISTAVGELILEITAAAFIGTTWKRFPNEPIKAYMKDSLLYMQVVPAITFLFIMLVAPIWRRRGETLSLGEFTETDAQTGAVLRRVPPRNAWCQRLIFAVFGALFCVVIYVAPWVYWSKFLSLPGALWCPPKLTAQGVIWIVFSTLGSFVGLGG